MAEDSLSVHWLWSVASVALATPSQVAKSQLSGHCWLGTNVHGADPCSKLGFVMTFTLLPVACARWIPKSPRLEREMSEKIRIRFLSMLLMSPDSFVLSNPSYADVVLRCFRILRIIVRIVAVVPSIAAMVMPSKMGGVLLSVF